MVLFLALCIVLVVLMIVVDNCFIHNINWNILTIVVLGGFLLFWVLTNLYPNAIIYI